MSAALALQQVQDQRRRFGCCGPGWPACFRWYGLEAEYRNADLLACQRGIPGLTREGAVVKHDDDSTRAIYRKNLAFSRVLADTTPTPEVATRFMKAVADASGQAHVAEVKENGQN